MKQIFAIILFLTTTQIVLGQFPTNKEKVDFENVFTITEDNGIDLISYYYSPKGEITQIVRKTKSNITNGKTEYLYNHDRQIQLAKKFTLISNSSGLKYSGKDEYIYDSNNNLKEIRIYSWGLNQPSNNLDKKTTFEYNSSKQLTKRTAINYRYNETISGTTEYLFRYDDSNQLVSEIRIKNGKLWMIEKLSYNENKKVVKKESYYPIENDYSYADSKFKSNLKKVEFENYQIESKPRGTANYTYNSQGFLISITDNNHYLNSEPYSITFKYQPYSETELQNKKNDITIDISSEEQIIKTENNSVKKEYNQIGFASFIPGVSQFKNDQTTKGLILIGSIGTSAYLSYNFKKRGDEKYNDYKLSTDVNEILDLYDDAEKYRKQSIAFASISGAIILYAIIDGYVVAKKRTQDSNITFLPNFDGESLTATLSIKF